MSIQYGNYQPLANSGHQRLGENNLGTPLKAILIPKGLQVAATADAAGTQSTYIALIKAAKASRILPMPLAVEYKYDGQADKFQDRPFSGKKFVYEGKDGFVLSLNLDSALHTQLRKLNFRNYDVIFVDTNRNIWGYSPDGVKMYGFATTDVHIGKLGVNDGSKAAQTDLTITLSNPSEWNDFGVYIDGKNLTWDPNNLDGCYDVNLEVTESASTSFTVSVNYAGIPTTDVDSQVVGLAKADFVLTKAGSPVSLSGATMVDNGDGTYSFTGITTMSGAHVVSLVAPASISVVAYQIDVKTTGSFTIS